MIKVEDIIYLCNIDNVKISNYLLKRNMENLNRFVDLINNVLLVGDRCVSIGKKTFVFYLGRTFYDRYLFGPDKDLNDNDIFIDDNNINKQLSEESFFIKHFLFRVERGKRYLNNYSVSKYKINKSLYDLYQERRRLKTEKQILKNVIEHYNFNTNSNPVIDTVDMKFDKKMLKEYFETNIRDYQFEILKSKYPYRTDTSLKSEIISFISAYAFFYEFLKSKKTTTINYTQSESGRYYSFLGQLDKRVRKHLLREYVEIDLDTAAPNCLYQTYYSLTGNNLKYINEIITNKKEVRSYIGEVLFLANKEIQKDIKIKYAKKILTALFFGSKANFSGKNSTNDVIKEVVEIQNKDKGFLKKTKDFFYNNKEIENIINDVNILMNTVDEHLKTVTKDDIMSINNRKINVTPKKKNKSKRNTRLAYYYQSWESQFLDEEIKILKKLRINKNYLKLHDALYIHKSMFKGKVTEEYLRDRFRKIRVAGNPFNIEPIL